MFKFPERQLPLEAALCSELLVGGGMNKFFRGGEQKELERR
jgi:hypothetical protein